MEKSDNYQCPNCQMIIPQMNIVFHQATCSGSQRKSQSQNQSQSQMEIEHDSYSQSNKRNFEDYPQVHQDYRKEKVDLKKLKQDPFPEKIICPKCTLPLELSQLEDHDKQCNYKTCRFCREYYPQEFIDHHEEQCIQKGIERQNSMSQSQSQQNDTNNNQYTQDQNNLLVNENGRQYAIRRVTTRTPFGIQTTIQRIPVNQMSQEDPWLIMNRQISENENQHQRLNNDHYVNFGSLFGRQMLQNSDDIFHRNDSFFQDFTNHGNFMRMNRHLLNFDMLSQLLEQLRNPQQGMNQQQVNQIPKQKFKKNPNTPKGEEEKCSICITEYDDGEEIRKLPCNHFFHPECVDTWLVQNSHCPICKKDLLEQQLNR